MTISKTNNPINPEGLKRLQSAKVFIAGHRGMVGSALMRRLEAAGCHKLLVRTHQELNLENQQQVQDFMLAEKPDYVFLAAAKVGGIYANQHFPAQFIYQNTMIAANMINAAHMANVQCMLNLGSSCIYPAESTQPMKESALLTGTLEPSNEPYAIAKIAAIKMCESYNREYKRDFRSAMPTNLYGSHDNFDLKTSHVLPALIRKFHEAKVTGADSVEVWGSGRPRREFLHVDDLAEACFHLMETYQGNVSVNIGTGEDLSIKALAELIKKTVGYTGAIVWNSDKPDGTPRKLLDVSLIHGLGWKHSIALEAGIKAVYIHKFLN